MAAFSLELSIPMAATDPTPLINSLYWLESSVIYESKIGERIVPSALLKNCGLVHLHLVKSAKATFIEPPPDVLQTLDIINWPLNSSSWKTWSSERFLKYWGEFVKRDDAKLDSQFETIKAMYEKVKR